MNFSKLPEETPAATQLGTAPMPDKNRALLYEEALTYIGEVLVTLRNRKGFNLEKGIEIIRKIVNYSHPQDPVLILALHKDDWRKYVIHHPVNVAIFAIKMADHLGFDRTQRVEIGMAGLLHDVGMAAIPENILFKQARLNNNEAKIFRQRPNLSTKILRTLGSEYAYVAECAAQVYERTDGSGYPRGLKAAEMHEYAQIIGLLDMYESLIHSRPQRGKWTPFAAVKEIINTSKNKFGKDYLKALLSIFTAFPIHSYVRLNSDAIGKVIETYPDQPLRPKIQIIYDSQKRKVLTEKIVALPEDPLLHIIDSISIKDIRQMTDA
ncbi:MAG: HD domain-containing phosphohydrolase [Desulfobacterales bacterium]|nr:HD domain-containing phosphohydrolase [Desulfobacterales bacterium]